MARSAGCDSFRNKKTGTHPSWPASQIVGRLTRHGSARSLHLSAVAVEAPPTSTSTSSTTSFYRLPSLAITDQPAIADHLAVPDPSATTTATAYAVHDPAPLLPSTITVSLRMQYRASFGQNICIVGESDALGNWITEKATEMQWTEGDVWIAKLELPASIANKLEYKYVVRDEDGSIARWSPGANHSIQLPSGILPVAADISDSWDKAHTSVATRQLPTRGRKVVAQRSDASVLDAAWLASPPTAGNEHISASNIEAHFNPLQKGVSSRGEWKVVDGSWVMVHELQGTYMPPHSNQLEQSHTEGVDAHTWADALTPTSPQQQDDLTEVARVVIQLQLKIAFGQKVCLVGAGCILGNWEIEQSVSMIWGEGDIWTAELDVPLSEISVLEYKYIVREADGQISRWSEGENYNLALPESPAMLAPDAQSNSDKALDHPLYPRSVDSAETVTEAQEVSVVSEYVRKAAVTDSEGVGGVVELEPVLFSEHELAAGRALLCDTQHAAPVTSHQAVSGSVSCDSSLNPVQDLDSRVVKLASAFEIPKRASRAKAVVQAVCKLNPGQEAPLMKKLADRASGEVTHVLEKAGALYGFDPCSMPAFEADRMLASATTKLVALQHAYEAIQRCGILTP